MTNLAAIVVGPLVAPECRRAAGRRRVFVARTLAGCASGAVVVAALAWWSINQQYDDGFRADGLVSFAAALVEFLALTIALILGPAVLAGSLAGEKERGSIGLLLSTRVDAREIVLGRTLGKLSMVGSLLLAFLPAQAAFAALNDLPAAATLAMVVLPAAVAFGAGGLGVAASSVASRGRNALIGMYLVEALLLLAFGLAQVAGLARAVPFLGALNPYANLGPLVRFGRSGGSWAAVGTWTAIGLGGIAFASSRLRPSYLRMVGGKGPKQRTRRRAIPPVPAAAPMVWKERYIERVAALGWFGRVLNVLLLLYLAVGGLVMAALADYALVSHPHGPQYDRVVTLIHEMYADPAPLFCGLIQLAAGLRAAVVIASERERGTWDGLLTSPLSGREILAGKLRGSLFALLPLVLAAALAWTVCAATGAMTVSRYAALIGYTAAGVVFAVALGVRASLATGTAARSMTLTVAGLLGAYTLLAALAGLLVLIAMVLLLFSWMIASQVGLIPSGGRPWVPFHLFAQGWNLAILGGFGLFTLMIVSESRLRFDALAGRIPPGDFERPTPIVLWSKVSRQRDKINHKADAEPPTETATVDELEPAATDSP